MSDSTSATRLNSRRRARRIRRLTGAVGAVFAAMALMIALAIPALGVHDDLFQLDGNTADDAAAVEPYDWENLFDDATPATVGGVTTAALPAGFIDAAFVTDWRQEADGTFDTSDGSTFATGSKDTLQINTGWACVGSNNVNNKTDITNAYATIVEDGGSRILYFGLEKGEDNGNNNVGMWLLQNDVSCPEDASPPGTAFSGVHADGDLFLVAAFTNGGGVSNITAYQWSTALNAIDPVPVAQGADCAVAADGDPICATTNAGSTGGTEFEPEWTHFSSKLGINNGLELATFFEGGIDLTAFDEFENSCFTGFIFNTRSSQELGATLFDYAQGDIDTCNPELSLEKTPDTGTHFVGDSFDWTIVVTNDGDGPADDAVVSDTIPAGLTINSATTPAGDCDVVGQEVTCTIDVAANGGTATITVNVTATSGVLTDPEECVLVENTASVTVEGDSDAGDNSDSGSVTICPIVVTKTAETTFTRTWEWDIDKSVDPDEWNLFTGESGTSEYTVDITRTGSVDSDWAVSGTITITNPASIAATLTEVTDVISPNISADVDCPALIVPANDSIDCTYSADLPDGANRTNTATATLQNSPSGTTDFSGTADVTFGDPTTVVNASVNVTDTVEGDLGTFSDTDSVSYTRTFECDADEGDHDNTAEIVETGQTASASVTVNCYEISVTKDAETEFTRTWTWDIDKTSDVTALELMPGQQFLDVEYEVTVTADPPVDSDHAVSGEITIANPNPTRDADLTAVVDSLTGGINATVDCPSMTVPAGDSLVCTYSADLPDDADRTNTATATQQLYDFDEDLVATPAGTSDHSGNAAVAFGDPTTEIDECITVTDTYAGDLGTACADESPKLFTYTRDIGPYTTDDCGENLVENTASFLTDDTGATGSDDHTIIVTVPCPEGCTLTQGYWKTHSALGPAPFDDNWNNLPDEDIDTFLEAHNETFFLSGMTWYQVFWTAPAGNPYYNLAHQYMAARLNLLNGASAPQEVLDAIDDAEDLFETYAPSDVGKGKAAKALRPIFTELAGILASYNEGDIGPGHCSEDVTSITAF
jgi:uncharacterized repeat protein (TIGR01451 family)